MRCLFGEMANLHNGVDEDGDGVQDPLPSTRSITASDGSHPAEVNPTGSQLSQSVLCEVDSIDFIGCGAVELIPLDGTRVDKVRGPGRVLQTPVPDTYGRVVAGSEDPAAILLEEQVQHEPEVRLDGPSLRQ